MFSVFSTISFLSLFAQSTHCIAMCGPHFCIKSKPSKKAYLIGRFFSYSLLAGTFGYFGQSLLKTLNLEFFKFLSFSIFLSVSVGIFAMWMGARIPLPKSFRRCIKSSPQKTPSFIQGLASAALPCATIFQMLGLSILIKIPLRILLATFIILNLFGFAFKIFKPIPEEDLTSAQKMFLCI